LARLRARLDRTGGVPAEARYVELSLDPQMRIIDEV
jgi:hypothetical protein